MVRSVFASGWANGQGHNAARTGPSSSTLFVRRALATFTSSSSDDGGHAQVYDSSHVVQGNDFVNDPAREFLLVCLVIVQLLLCAHLILFM